MKGSPVEILAAVLLSGLMASVDLCGDPVDFVDPMIGTVNTGQTFPAVGLPFAMTQWTPQTQDTEKGTMVFKMGSVPNKRWGSKPENVTPSLSRTE